MERDVVEVEVLVTAASEPSLVKSQLRRVTASFSPSLVKPLSSEEHWCFVFRPEIHREFME